MVKLDKSRRSVKGPQKAKKGYEKDDLDPLLDSLSETRTMEVAADEPPEIAPLPWETPSEYTKFCYFLRTPRPHSVRAAYRLYCEDRGTRPKKNPSSSWYRAYRGEFAAFRRAERQMAAIERAARVYGRVSDWEGLEAARESGAIGKHGGETGEVADSLTLIQWAFWSLAIEERGDPIPGVPTWEERRRQYWEAQPQGGFGTPMS